MNGQLWEPCPRCDTEPVCADCGYCQTHCSCAQQRADRKYVAEFEKQNPGFLDAYANHMEQGVMER